MSVSGYTSGAQAGGATGRQPNFLMLDGMHIHGVLSGQVDLVDLLHALLRELADKGQP